MSDVARHLLRNPPALAGTAVALAVVLGALLAPWLAPHPADALGAVHPERKLQPPGPGQWLGTDELGRDLLSRILYGARLSLLAAALAIGLALVIGVPLGLLAGYAGGRADLWLMRLTDVMLGFPPLLLAVALAAAFGPSLVNAMVATALAWWPWYARIVRAEAAALRARPFVEAARAGGASDLRILLRHVLPNALPPVIVQASLDVGSVILTAAALGFLGLGAQPPQPEWGLMVSTGRTFLLTHPWAAVAPGLAIFVTALAFNLLGDGLREALDPRLRGRAAA